MPGEEWLYAKIFAGWATIDKLLIGLVAPLVNAYGSAIESWFFVRYPEPEPHLRLRLRGQPDVLRSSILGELQSRLRPLVENRSVVRLELDTYSPEIGRYGGVQGAMLAERIFHADSLRVLAGLERSAAGLADERARRLAGICSCDRLLHLLVGHGENVRLAAAATEAREAMLGLVAKRLGSKEQVSRGHHERSAWLRGARDEIRSTMQSPHDGLCSEAIMAAATDYRRLGGAGELTVPFRGVVRSLLHMHCNRHFRMNANSEEVFVYDALARWYTEAEARSNRTSLEA